MTELKKTNKKEKEAMKKATLKLGTICALVCASASMSWAAEPMTTIGFEAGEADVYKLNKYKNTTIEATTDSEKVISGKASVLCDKTQSADEWCEFFCSKPAQLPLKANGTYTVSFKYRILEKTDDKGYLHFMVRSAIGKNGPADRAWTVMNDTSGSSGTKVVTFTLGDFSDYRILFGYRLKGKVVIDDIKVFEGTVAEQDAK
jgi:hypothetical protein